MSFGLSIEDFVLLTQLANTTVQDARKACGAHGAMTQEIKNLHSVLRSLEAELSKPESVLDKPRDNRTKELSRLARGCEKLLKLLSQYLHKHNELSEGKGSLTKLWQRVKFRNGVMLDMGDYRSQLTTYTQAITRFLNLVSMKSGKVENCEESYGEELREIKELLDRARLPPGLTSRSQEQLQAKRADLKDVSLPNSTPFISQHSGVDEGALDDTNSQAPTTRYRYTTLNENMQEIRFLALLPGPKHAEIRICIYPGPLYFTPVDGPTLVRDFEALSYTWGSPENPRDILIGESGSQTLSITQNLYEALPYLRHKDNVRLLWIDAIFVNQEDPVERTSQVKRMAEIYSRAKMVLIWVGVEHDDSSIAIEHFRHLATQVRVDWGLNKIVSLVNDRRYTSIPIELQFDDIDWTAIAKLLDRDWFKRLWIWQEAGLSRDATMMCGSSSVPWISVRTAIFCVLTTGKSVAFDRVVELSHSRLLSGLSLGIEEFSFSDLLRSTSGCYCTDPRDRVFALLSMVPTYEKFHLEPDYTSNLHEVYENTLSHYLEVFEDLSLLNGVELSRRLDRTPSWLPQWNASRITEPLSFGYASGGSPCSAHFKQIREKNILSVTGITSAAVDRVEDFELPQVFFIDDVRNELRRVAEQLGLLDRIASTMFPLQHLCQILVSTHLADNYIPSNENYSTISGAERFLRQLSDLDPDEFSDSIEAEFFVDSVSTFCNNRCLFVTKDVKIGLGPRGMQSGDVVTALLGSRRTMILRPASEGKYEVVGEAHCSETLDGEAFLGPLPANFDLVLRYNIIYNQYFLNFRNEVNGTLQIEDPRLADVTLPNGWRRDENSESEYVDRYTHDETGKSTDFDPRMTAEELRKRGIKLEEFDLI